MPPPDILFLDLDGVLRRPDTPALSIDRECAASFCTALRPFEELRIVISSTWRLGLLLSEIKATLPKEVAGRIVGKTPHLPEAEAHQRYAEILRYCAQHDIGGDAWLAIDDRAELFPASAPLLLTDPEVGFDSGCIVSLWERMGVA